MNKLFSLMKQKSVFIFIVLNSFVVVVMVTLDLSTLETFQYNRVMHNHQPANQK